jgi:hypothetical protein
MPVGDQLFCCIFFSPLDGVRECPVLGPRNAETGILRDHVFHAIANSVLNGEAQLGEELLRAGLYPLNPEKVLQSIQKLPAPELKVKRDHPIAVAQHDEPLQNPVTSEDLASLRRKLEQNIDVLEDDGRARFL